MVGIQPWEVFTNIKTHSGAKHYPGVSLPSVPSCLDSVQAAEVAHICGVETWLLPSQWMGGQSCREERSLLNSIKLLTGKKFSFELVPRLPCTTSVSLGEAEGEISAS